MEEYTEVLELEPKNSSASFKRADILASQKNYEEAFEEYKKGLEFEPQNAHAYLKIAEISSGQGNIKEAIKSFKKTIQLYPANASAHYQLAKIYSMENNFKDALKGYGKALKLTPKNVSIHLDLADLYFRMGNLKEAEKAEPILGDRLRIIRREVGNAHRETLRCLSDLASLYIELSDHSKAVELLNPPANRPIVSSLAPGLGTTSVAGSSDTVLTKSFARLL